LGRFHTLKKLYLCPEDDSVDSSQGIKLLDLRVEAEEEGLERITEVCG
jgi:hypothetical protein